MFAKKYYALRKNFSFAQNSLSLNLKVCKTGFYYEEIYFDFWLFEPLKVNKK